MFMSLRGLNSALVVVLCEGEGGKGEGGGIVL